MFVRIFIINIYIRLVFSLTLELLSFKLRIYFLVFFMLVLSLVRNLNYKAISYDQAKRFFEIWVLDVYMLDKFIY